jgi:hypothetical protein
LPVEVGWKRACEFPKSGALSLKIYLLSLDDERCVFYSEGPEIIADAAVVAVVPRTGLRGWVERKYKSLQMVLTESEKGVGLRVRRIWEWLQLRTYVDEPLLRSLRGVRGLELNHPPSLTEDETHRIWKEYLKSRQGRHAFWFVINTLVSPLTLLLAPLPGPNLIGYWFVYRAVCHWLARLGARQARKNEGVETTFQRTEALDGSFGGADEERIACLSSTLSLQGLGAFIERATQKGAKARRKTLLTVS